MIIISENSAGVNNQPIKAWVVYFRSPFGISRTINEAIDICKKNEFNPDLCIIPVPVAITDTSYEVFIR